MSRSLSVSSPGKKSFLKATHETLMVMRHRLPAMGSRRGRGAYPAWTALAVLAGLLWGTVCAGASSGVPSASPGAESGMPSAAPTTVRGGAPGSTSSPASSAPVSSSPSTAGPSLSRSPSTESPTTRQPSSKTPVFTPAGPSRPHLILSVADDLGNYDVGFNNPIGHTPNINSLLASGMRLNRHYASRMCAPSRAMLLSGRPAWTLGLHPDFNLNPVTTIRCGVPTNTVFLPQLLSKAGYATHMLGKWHLGNYESTFLPNNRGYDAFVGYLPGSITHMGPQQFQSAQCACLGNGKQTCFVGSSTKATCPSIFSMVNISSTRPGYQAITAPWESYTDIFLAQEATRIIYAHNSSKPLFLHLSWGSPHDPIMSPQQYLNQITQMPSSSTSNLAKMCGSSLVLSKRKTILGMVAALDDAIGRVVQALKSRNMWANSVFVFMSDNGGNMPNYSAATKMCAGFQWGSNYPLRGGKYSFFEGGVRTVAFVASPLLNPLLVGTSYSGMVSITDWFATFAALGKVPSSALPHGLDSIDFSGRFFSSGTSSLFANRTSLVMQYWPEANRYVAMALIGDKLFKLMQGWPSIGYGMGLQGPISGVSPGASIDQPPELANANTNYSILAAYNSLNCMPQCLFEVANDPSEQLNLSPGSYPKEMAVLNALLVKAGPSYVSVGNSGICAAGWLPGNTLTTTDAASVAVSRKAGWWTYWVNPPPPSGG